MLARLRTHTEDAILYARLFGRSVHISRDPDVPLPEHGRLTLTYAMARIDPLPEPLNGVAFALNLRLPWDWWAACCLLDLARSGEGRWAEPRIDDAPLKPHALPRYLPALGILYFVFHR